MSFFESPPSNNTDKIIAKRGIEKSSAPEKINLGRRNFLRAGGAIAAAVVAEEVYNNLDGVKKIANYFRSTEDVQSKDEEEVIFEQTEEQSEINIEDARAIEEFIKYDTPGNIELAGINLPEILIQNWKKQYQEKIELRDSLCKAYGEMDLVKEKLKGIFRDVGVPEEYIYLAIPESHWDLNAKNKTGALGPYQLLEETAVRHGLKVGGKHDQRMDPFLSCQACAKELKRLYEETHGNWDLAFSAYNGGKVFKYTSKLYTKKERNKEGRLFHYEGFLKYAGEKITAIRNEIRDNSYLKHEVAEGETISGIAKKFDRSEHEIKTFNKLKSDKLKPKQIVLIPLHDKEEDFKRAIERSHFIENLNYPAKFKAVMELINEGFATKQRKNSDGRIHLAANK
jgi:LysM repeat protein